MLDTYPYPPVFADAETAKANAHRRAGDLQRLLTVAEGDDYIRFFHVQAAFWLLHGWYMKSDGAVAQAISRHASGKHRIARNRVSNEFDKKITELRKLLRALGAKQRAARSPDPPPAKAA